MVTLKVRRGLQSKVVRRSLAAGKAKGLSLLWILQTEPVLPIL